jgi:hypothetical protein
VIIEPYARTHRVAVQRIYRETLAAGSPHPFTYFHYGTYLAAYEHLCLGWYLGPGADHAVMLRAGADVVGYALVCVDEAAFRRWQRHHAARLVGGVVPRLAFRRFPPVVDRFYRLRLRDGWNAMARRDPPAPAHAHVNVIADDAFAPGRRLAEHVDALCRRRGIPAWYGEINARRGRRVRALERWGARVVRRTESHTFSWLCGGPVDRLTVVRPVPHRARSAVPAAA